MALSRDTISCVSRAAEIIGNDKTTKRSAQRNDFRSISDSGISAPEENMAAQNALRKNAKN